MRLLLVIHNVVSCYFMLAPVAVDGRHSPPAGTTANFIRLRQSTAIIISLSLLLAPVAVNAGFEECDKLPNGVVQQNSETGKAFVITPTKDADINALFSVGYNQPLVVHTAKKFDPGASVTVRVSSDDDCYSTVTTVAGEDPQFSITRKCVSSSSRPFSKNIFINTLVVTFNKKSVEYASATRANSEIDKWDGCQPYVENEEEDWTLWNLTFTVTSRSAKPLTIYMDDTVKIKCSFLDTTTTSATTETQNSIVTGPLRPVSPASGDKDDDGKTLIAGLVLWQSILVIVAGFILLLLVIAGIVFAVVCIYRRKKRKAPHSTSTRLDDKSQKSKKPAKPAERKKEPTDLERWEAYINRSTETAKPMRPLKPVDQMRHDWFEKNKKTNSFRKQFFKWEAEHMRKHPSRYDPPMWDEIDNPTERENTFYRNCREVEMWIKGGFNENEHTQSGPTIRTTRKKVKESSSKKQRNASAKSTKPVKSKKSAKSTKTAFEKLDIH